LVHQASQRGFGVFAGGCPRPEAPLVAFDEKNLSVGDMPEEGVYENA
jgi:hypothetical protein